MQDEVVCESFGVSGGGEGDVWTACADAGGVCAASVRRPDCGCGAEWTPCADVGGVQIEDVGRNGRHVRVGVASRFLMW